MRISGSVVKFIAKLGVSALLLTFLLKKISFDDLSRLLDTLDPAFILLALAVFLTSNLLGSVQWHMLLTASGVPVSFHQTIRFYFVGLFFNNFLPANIGGDAVKVYDVSRMGSSVYRVIAVTLLDRIIGIFSLCFLATIAVLFLMDIAPFDMLGLYLAIFLGCMVPALAFYFVQPLSKFVRWLIRWLRLFSIDRRGESILNHLGEFKTRKSLLLRLMVLSMVIQSLRVSTHVLVGMALGIHIDTPLLLLFFVVVPLLSLAMIPPVTINGLGVREGLGMLLFAGAGIGRTDAFTLEFLTYLVSVSISLVGLVFYLTRRGGPGGTTANSTSI